MEGGGWTLVRRAANAGGNVLTTTSPHHPPAPPATPSLNNGGGGEWASNAVPWPYQDGTCALNGGFSTNANGCAAGNGDSFCSPSNWSPQTGIAATGRYKVNILVMGGAAAPSSDLLSTVEYTADGETTWTPVPASNLTVTAAGSSTDPYILTASGLGLTQFSPADTHQIAFT